MSDQGPQALDAFTDEIRGRLFRVGEYLWLVLSDGVPVGAIGMSKAGHERKFAGICFTESVHGTGIPLEAVSMVLEAQYRRNIYLVQINCFESNKRVIRFFEKLGAVTIDTVPSENTQNGKMVLWRRMVITADDFQSYRGRAVNQVRRDHTADIQGVTR